MSESVVPTSSVASTTDARKNWTPKGVLAWLLTISASLLTVIMSGLAYCMFIPVRWDGLGELGALALFFPLHLLVVTLVGAVLTVAAHRSQAQLAALLFGFVTILTAVMALTPTVAVWRAARKLNVPLSLRTYMAHASHLNSGDPRRDKSVVYGTTSDGTQLELDVWQTGLPHTGPLRPAMVFVHGGAWIHGNRSMFPDWDRWFNELGYEVFDVEYRMPPSIHWQDEIADVKAALGWVALHAKEYHIDPTQIMIMGDSAGGNLAMLAAYTVGDPQLAPSTDVPPVPVRNVISLYGPCDLALLYHSSSSLEFLQAAMNQYIGGPPEEFPERYRSLSPRNHINAQAPPTMMILGTSDRIIRTDQAEALNQELDKAGVRHEIVLLPGNDHGFDTNWGGLGTQIARARIRVFLQRKQTPDN